MEAGVASHWRPVLGILAVAAAVSLSSCGESNCQPSPNANGVTESNCPKEEAGGGYEGEHRDDRENPLDAPRYYKPPPIDKPPPIEFK